MKNKEEKGKTIKEQKAGKERVTKSKVQEKTEEEKAINK